MRRVKDNPIFSKENIFQKNSKKCLTKIILRDMMYCTMRGIL